MDPTVEIALIGAVVALCTVLTPIVMSVITARQRAAEKREDYERQDLVAKRAQAAAEKVDIAAKKAAEAAKVVAVQLSTANAKISTQLTAIQGQTTQIHELVNGGKTVPPSEGGQ